jgi:hypothetical protein
MSNPGESATGCIKVPQPATTESVESYHSRKLAVLWRCVRVHKGAGEKHGGKNPRLSGVFRKRGARATLETSSCVAGSSGATSR